VGTPVRLRFKWMLKLKDVKATKSMAGCRTLLHFLARQLLLQVRCFDRL
jgi:hypothetical protein